jgi:thiamine kinase-like enzyme
VSEDPNIPYIKDLYYKKLDLIKEHLDEKHWQKAYKLVKNIPDRETFVHGDCHFKNIMVQQDELLLIDMDTLSKGHPIFELSAIYCSYIAFEEDDPGNSLKFLGVPPELCQKIFNDIIVRYCGKDDQTIKDKIALLCYIHMLWWNKVNTPDNLKRLEGCRSRLLPLLDKYDDVSIGL